MCWDSEFILLHELAHVWIDRNVSDATREAFMALRNDVEAWASADVPWASRRQEQT